VVCFDPQFAKTIRDWNKKKNDAIIEDNVDPHELEELHKFMKDKKYYTFHGEHRRAALSYLHEVSFFIDYLNLFKPDLQKKSCFWLH